MVQYIIAKHGAIHNCKALCKTYYVKAPLEGYVKARASARKHPGKVTSKHGRQPANTLGRLHQSTGVSPQAPWEVYVKAQVSAHKHHRKVT